MTTAQAELDRANENLAAATLTAPITGTVGTIGMTAGTAIRGGEQIVIIGAGAVKVTVNVPLASIRKVKVGQPAAVTPDGATTAVDGTVHSIGLLPAAATTRAAQRRRRRPAASPTRSWCSSIGPRRPWPPDRRRG